MTKTSLSATQIAKLTAALTGGGFKRAATKEAAAKRFLAIAKEKGLGDPASLLLETYDDAYEIIHRSLGSIAVGKAIKAQKDAKPKAVPSQPAPNRTKRAVMLDMVCSKSGATEPEICKAIGWKACLVTLRRAAAAEGVKLRVEKVKGERTRYFGTRA